MVSAARHWAEPADCLEEPTQECQEHWAAMHWGAQAGSSAASLWWEERRGSQVDRAFRTAQALLDLASCQGQL